LAQFRGIGAGHFFAEQLEIATTAQMTIWPRGTYLWFAKNPCGFRIGQINAAGWTKTRRSQLPDAPQYRI
jgi:hypothetical protein